MKKSKLLSLILLIIGGGFLVLGSKLGLASYVISSISFITWAIIFITPKRQ